MEEKKTVTMYKKDYDLLMPFYERHKGREFASLPDAMRVLVEYANAHGVLQS